MIPHRDNFLLAWNVGALFSVFLPLLIWIISKLVRGGNDDDDKNEDEQSSPWWSWGNGQQAERGPEDQQGQGAILFVYLWGLLSFGLIVWYGNAVFHKGAHPLPLISSLVVFCNACLMCLLLVCSLGINYDERQLEERGWLPQFGACSTLTYACFMLYSIIFIFVIRRRIRTGELKPSNGAVDEDKVSRDSSAVSTDYQREPSSQQEEQREPNHIKASWTFY